MRASRIALAALHPPRVAIAGSGCAALSAAIHLSPLVHSGVVAAPVDLYCVRGNEERDVGVGIWSTALAPLHDCNPRLASRLVRQGEWLEDVAYLNPCGETLLHSRLSSPRVNEDGHSSLYDEPGLLYISEGEFINELWRCVDELSTKGFVRYRHHTPPQPDQAQLKQKQQHQHDEHSPSTSHSAPSMNHRSTWPSPEDLCHYDVVLDGMGACSSLRCSRTSSSSFSSSSSSSSSLDPLEPRGYVVYRGMAPLSVEDVGMDGLAFQTWGEGRAMRFAMVPVVVGSQRVQKHAWYFTIDEKEHHKKVLAHSARRVGSDASHSAASAMGGALHQTPRPLHQIEDGLGGDGDSSTTSNAASCALHHVEDGIHGGVEDPRPALLEWLSGWHPPIARVVQATPPHHILVDEAMAHSRPAPPTTIWGGSRAPGGRGGGAGEDKGLVSSLAHIGDAYCTTDPVLAQGFTLAMEQAAGIAREIHAWSMVQQSINAENTSSSSSSSSMLSTPVHNALMDAHHKHWARVRRVQRVSSIVQALAQPQTQRPIQTFLLVNVLRRAMKHTPHAIKRWTFDRVLRHSLGA